MQSVVLFSVVVWGRQIDVVEQSGDGEVFFDLFDSATGECVNLGAPIYETLSESYAAWPEHLRVMVEEFVSVEFGV